MGAPLINWIFRFVIAAAAVGGSAAVLRLPVPLAARAVMLVGGAAAGLVLAFRYLPAFDPFGRVRWRLPRLEGAPACALTFDDGPGPETGAVLDILRREDVRATFFLLGVNAQRYPETVRRMASEGHAVGLHGMEHRKLAGAPSEEVERQLDLAMAALAQIGVSPAALYRVPHGYKSSPVFRAAARRGVTIWAWSRGVWDTAGPSPATLVARATRWVRPGMVLLLHDGRGEDPNPDVSSMLAALPEIVHTLKARGFRFVTLASAEIR
jgi:peptidoglycan-N-acetylglucosamine deacetylase